MISETQCRRYCYEPLELIENFYMAVSSPERWDCHHRVETIMNCSRKDLVAKDCYWNRPAHELVFLPHEEHIRLHRMGQSSGMLGLRHSEETKKKMREAKLGTRLSEETKKKMREANLGEKHPAYGKKWWNDGIKTAISRECPGPGFVKGMLPKGVGRVFRSPSPIPAIPE